MVQMMNKYLSGLISPTEMTWKWLETDEPTLRLINFVMMNGNRMLALISLRKASQAA